MAETVLGNVLAFFVRLGIYDVVLPFLLVFTLVYAILERSRVLGTEKIGNTEYTKRNLNAMAAFTVAFLVIASGKLVETITSVSSNMVVLLFLGVFFMLLIGSFYGQGELEKGLQGGWRTTFLIIMFVGIVGIFLNAIKTASGQTWLDYAFSYLRANWSSTAVASIVFVALIVWFISYVAKGEAPKKEEKKA
ncbi:MAG TPA: hypothetical protein VLJ21_03860 [Candidatus Binatia bacterium]|nr:hypothetical protein [Candidatus Binatia bacterium]